jgi:hypothetical protein
MLTRERDPSGVDVDAVGSEDRVRAVILPI